MLVEDNWQNVCEEVGIQSMRMLSSVQRPGTLYGSRQTLNIQMVMLTRCLTSCKLSAYGDKEGKVLHAHHYTCQIPSAFCFLHTSSYQGINHLQ